MSTKALGIWSVIFGLGIAAALGAAATTGGAPKRSTQMEHTQAGGVTDSQCECVCGSPSPGQSPCE